MKVFLEGNETLNTLRYWLSGIAPPPIAECMYDLEICSRVTSFTRLHLFSLGSINSSVDSSASSGRDNKTKTLIQAQTPASSEQTDPYHCIPIPPTCALQLPSPCSDLNNTSPKNLHGRRTSTPGTQTIWQLSLVAATLAQRPILTTQIGTRYYDSFPLDPRYQ
jgi:hypothetical protein